MDLTFGKWKVSICKYRHTGMMIQLIRIIFSVSSQDWGNPWCIVTEVGRAAGLDSDINATASVIRRRAPCKSLSFKPHWLQTAAVRRAEMSALYWQSTWSAPLSPWRWWLLGVWYRSPRSGPPGPSPLSPGRRDGSGRGQAGKEGS